MAVVSRKQDEGRATPLTEQWPYVRFLGLGAWWAWIWLCYNSTEITRMFPTEQQTLMVVEMYLFSTLSIATCMFVSAAGWKRATVLIDKRGFVIGLGVLAGLSTILLGFSAVSETIVPFALSAILTGLGTSALCLKVGRIYGSIPLGDALTAGSISLIFAALLYFTGVGIPEAWRLFYVAALPLISGLLLTMRPADQFHAEVSGAGEEHNCAPVQRLYHKLVAASALVALTAGTGKGVTGALVDNGVFARTGGITVFFIGVIAVCIIFMVNRGDAVRGARQVYSALMVLGMGMMLATCFGFDIAMLSIGKESLWLVLSCFMAYLAFRYDLSPVRMFGIGQGAYFLGSAAGWGVGWFLSSYYDIAIVHTGTGIAMAFLIIVVFVYVFPENDLKRIMAWSVDGDVPHVGRGGMGSRAANADSESVPSDVAVISATVPSSIPSSTAIPIEQGKTARESGLARAADPRYGLSARELEILDLFAQGRSANWIADSLTISKNTVRSHLRAIYTKLDVHTRQELLDLLAGKE